MAGAGYKDFTTGEILTAANVDNYLMEQTVMVFADAAARTTALASVLAEGMISYLKDTNSTEYYSGSAWVAIGGSTSPLTTKGDLYGFSTTNARVPVGANGTILTADSSAATGVAWATNSSVGKVLQVVYNSYSTATTSSSSAFADTGLTATITPSSASNKVLVIFSQNAVQKSAAAANLALSIRLVRGATTLQTPAGSVLYTNTALELRGTSVAGTHLDSPATTSAVTYKTTFASGNNNASVTVQQDGATSSITLLEIGA